MALILFADSFGLFSKSNADSFILNDIIKRILIDNLQASYLGVSNDDKTEYFEIFEAAMNNINIKNIKHIKFPYSSNDLEYLSNSNIILLSGGDAQVGMKKLEQSSIPAILLNKYSTGQTILIGISAGAMQLGTFILSENNQEHVVNGMGLIPCIVSAHDEPEWSSLKHIVQTMGASNIGLGISFGSGSILFRNCDTLKVLFGDVYQFEMVMNNLCSQKLL
jgi:peptidase E